MNILLTGASGFIGSHLTKLLTKQGHQIFCLSRNPESLVEPVKASAIKFEIGKDEVKLTEWGEMDLLIHCAWDECRDLETPRQITEYFPNHLKFILSLVEQGLTDITCLGTCFEFGLKEGEINDYEELSPVTAYGFAKSYLLQSLSHLLPENVNFKWARVFYTYGVGQNPNSLFGSLAKAIEDSQSSFSMSKGDQMRDYLPVETLVGLISSVALQDEITGPINCASGRAISVYDLVQKIKEEKKSDIEVRRGDLSYLIHEPFKSWAAIENLQKISGIDDILNQRS